MTATFHSSVPTGTEDPEKPHIILVGLPGAGKTTIGMEVATLLRRTFLDLDREIERREGTSVREIFGVRGEDYFRAREQKVTRDLSQTGNMILAPGGGWIANSANVDTLRPPSRMVYLRVSPELALSRMGDSVHERPLLQPNDPLGALQKLYRDREQMYMRADLCLDTEVMTQQDVVQALLEYAAILETT